MLEQRTNNLPKVVVGGLIYQNKKILICQRKEEGDHPLKWEFPGGKLKDAENNQEALKRELKEELNIKVKIQEFLITTNYTYPDFKVKMHVYECKLISEKITLNEHIGYEWSKIDELKDFKWLDADIQIIDLLLNKYK